MKYTLAMTIPMLQMNTKLMSKDRNAHDWVAQCCMEYPFVPQSTMQKACAFVGGFDSTIMMGKSAGSAGNNYQESLNKIPVNSAIFTNQFKQWAKCEGDQYDWDSEQQGMSPLQFKDYYSFVCAALGLKEITQEMDNFIRHLGLPQTNKKNHLVMWTAHANK